MNPEEPLDPAERPLGVWVERVSVPNNKEPGDPEALLLTVEDPLLAAVETLPEPNKELLISFEESPSTLAEALLAVADRVPGEVDEVPATLEELSASIDELKEIIDEPCVPVADLSVVVKVLPIKEPELDSKRDMLLDEEPAPEASPTLPIAEDGMVVPLETLGEALGAAESLLGPKAPMAVEEVK